MEQNRGEAQNAYTVAVAAAEKFCIQNHVIMKITESFPFVVHFTIDAPLTLLEAGSGELVAPKIIVTVGIDSTVKIREDKAIETSLLKKLIRHAGGLAHLFFCRTAEALYEKINIEVKTQPLTEEQLAEIADRLREEADRRSGAFA